MIRLLPSSSKKPFALTTYALGVAGCFIMPERVAKTDPFKQISEAVGSGPFKFVRKTGSPARRPPG